MWVRAHLGPHPPLSFIKSCKCPDIEKGRMTAKAPNAHVQPVRTLPFRVGNFNFKIIKAAATPAPVPLSLLKPDNDMKLKPCLVVLCLIVALQKPLHVLKKKRKTTHHYNAVPKVLGVHGKMLAYVAPFFQEIGEFKGRKDFRWRPSWGLVTSLLSLARRACGFECVSVCWQTNYSCYFEIIWGHNLGVCPSPLLACVLVPFKWSAFLLVFPPIFRWIPGICWKSVKWFGVRRLSKLIWAANFRLETDAAPKINTRKIHQEK